MHVSFEVCHMPHVMIGSSCVFLWNWLSIQEIILSSVGSKGLYVLYRAESRCLASGQILSLATSHLTLHHSLDFGFGGKSSGCRNCFWQDWLACSLLFNVQDMILLGSCRFLNRASTSLDGCCLYIIIHNGMSLWDQGVWQVWTRIFKAVDTYVCS